MRLERSDLRRLSNRQREVLFLLCKGLRNGEMAQHLGISERTVKGYVSQLLVIFDVTNRTELVGKLALENPVVALSFSCGELPVTPDQAQQGNADQRIIDKAKRPVPPSSGGEQPCYRSRCEIIALRAYLKSRRFESRRGFARFQLALSGRLIAAH